MIWYLNWTLNGTFPMKQPFGIDINWWTQVPRDIDGRYEVPHTWLRLAKLVYNYIILYNRLIYIYTESCNKYDMILSDMIWYYILYRKLYVCILYMCTLYTICYTILYHIKLYYIVLYYIYFNYIILYCMYNIL